MPVISFAQVDYLNEARNDLKKLDTDFKNVENQLNIAKDSLVGLTKNLSSDIPIYYQEVSSFIKERDSLYNLGKTYLDFYSQKKVPQDSLDSFFKLPEVYTIGIENKEVEETTPEKVYMLFGDENIILKESILNDPITNKIFSNVFNSESETHFGDFWFPMDGQRIPILKKNQNEDWEEFTKLKFDRLTLDLYEGSISDIKVYLKNSSGKTIVFENSCSISLLKFGELAEKNYLHISSQQTRENGLINLNDSSIKVSDILQYYTGLNGNYIPNDERFSFPILIENERTNKNASNRYELRQSTALNNILDLRTYTDILGIGGTTPNGIAQFEGQADFFIIPFRLPEGWWSLGLTDFYLFKKIKPYVLYARLDDEDQYLEIEDNVSMTTKTISEPLEHLQKSYLDAGLKLDVISFKLGKNFPFEAIFYGVARYQISKVRLDSDSYNYKTLGAGGGLALEFRRFENFKLNIFSEYIKYNQEAYNNLSDFQDPEPFWVYRNEIEVSYYPSKKKMNAIFMRMRVFDNQDSLEGSNFFQWQLGYRFTVGMGNLKTKG